MTDGPEADPGNSGNDPEKDKEFQTRRQGAVYQGAFEAVIAILVAALAGYWLDGYFETEPVFLILGVVLGFSSFVVRLLRLGRWIQETDDSGANDGKESTDGDG